MQASSGAPSCQYPHCLSDVTAVQPCWQAQLLWLMRTGARSTMEVETVSTTCERHLPMVEVPVGGPHPGRLRQAPMGLRSAR